MSNASPSPRSRRSAKPHKVKSIKLAAHLLPIVEQSTIGGATAVLELGAAMIQFLASEAAIGNEKAISLLAKFGVEAKMEEEQPIVVSTVQAIDAPTIITGTSRGLMKVRSALPLSF